MLFAVMLCSLSNFTLPNTTLASSNYVKNNYVNKYNNLTNKLLTDNTVYGQPANIKTFAEFKRDIENGVLSVNVKYSGPGNNVIFNCTVIDRVIDKCVESGSANVCEDVYPNITIEGNKALINGMLKDNGECTFSLYVKIDESSLYNIVEKDIVERDDLNNVVYIDDLNNYASKTYVRLVNDRFTKYVRKKNNSILTVLRRVNNNNIQKAVLDNRIDFGDFTITVNNLVYAYYCYGASYCNYITTPASVKCSVEDNKLIDCYMLRGGCSADIPKPPFNYYNEYIDNSLKNEKGEYDICKLRERVFESITIDNDTITFSLNTSLRYRLLDTRYHDTYTDDWNINTDNLYVEHDDIDYVQKHELEQLNTSITYQINNHISLLNNTLANYATVEEHKHIMCKYLQTTMTDNNTKVIQFDKYISAGYIPLAMDIIDITSNNITVLVDVNIIISDNSVVGQTIIYEYANEKQMLEETVEYIKVDKNCLLIKLKDVNRVTSYGLSTRYVDGCVYNTCNGNYITREDISERFEDIKCKYVKTVHNDNNIYEICFDRRISHGDICLLLNVDSMSCSNYPVYSKAVFVYININNYHVNSINIDYGMSILEDCARLIVDKSIMSIVVKNNKILIELFTDVDASLASVISHNLTGDKLYSTYLKGVSSSISEDTLKGAPLYTTGSLQNINGDNYIVLNNNGDDKAFVGFFVDIRVQPVNNIIIFTDSGLIEVTVDDSTLYTVGDMLNYKLNKVEQACAYKVVAIKDASTIIIFK